MGSYNSLLVSCFHLQTADILHQKFNTAGQWFKFNIGETKGVKINCLVNSSKTSLISCREEFLEIIKSASKSLDHEAPSLPHNVSNFFTHDNGSIRIFEDDWPQIARAADASLDNGQYQRKNNVTKVCVYAI